MAYNTRRLKQSALIVVIGLGLGALAFFGTRANDLDARTSVVAVATLEHALGLRAQVEHTAFETHRGVLVLRGVALRDAQGRSVVTARSIEIGASWAALLRGEVDLSSVRAQGAVLSLQDSDVQRLSAIGKQTKLPFQTLMLSDSRIAVQSTELGTLAIDGATLELSAGEPQHKLMFAAASGSIVRDGRSTKLIKPMLEATSAGTAWNIARAGAEIGGARIALSHAQLEPSTGDFKAKLQSEGELSALLAVVSASGPAITGLATSELDVVREHGIWTWKGHGELRSLAFQGRAIAQSAKLALSSDGSGLALDGRLERDGHGYDLRATLRSEQGAIELADLSLHTGSGALLGHVKLDAQGVLDAQLSAADANVAELAALTGLGESVALEGHGKLDVRISGKLEALVLHAKLELAQTKIAAVALGSLNAELELNGQAQTLKVVRATANDRTHALSSEDLALHWADGRVQAHGALAIAKLPLSELYAALGASDDPALARLQADSVGSLTLAFDHNAQKLDLALELGAPRFDGHAFERGQLEASVGFGANGARDDIALESLVLAAGEGTLSLAGRIARRGELALNVAIEKLPLARMTGDALPWSALQAVVSGQGSFTGTVDAPQGSLALELDDTRIAQLAFGHQALKLTLASKATAPQAAVPSCEAGLAALRNAAASNFAHAWLVCGGRDGLHVDIALGSGSSRAVGGRIEVSGADLSPWLPADRDGDPLAGKLSAALVLDAGALATPDSLSGRLEVSALSLGKGTHALRAAAPFTLKIDHGQVTADQGKLIGVGDKVELALGATGGLSNLQLTADGVLKVSTLAREGLVPLVSEAYGDVDVHVVVAPGQTPLLRARLLPHDLIVHFSHDLVVRKLAGTLEIEDGVGKLEALEGSLGGGTLRLSGALQMSGLSVASYDLALGAESISLQPQERFEVVFGADAKLVSGQGKAPPSLTGVVKVAHLLYGRYIQLPEALVAMNKSERAVASGYDPARDRLRVDLKLEHAEPLVVRNNFLDAELALRGSDQTLRVVGSDQRVGLVGELAVLHGRVLFRGDEFEITRGKIAFADEKRIDPMFDFLAVAQKRTRPDASIVFSARGDREAFKLGVHCEASAPVEPQPFSCDFANDELRCDSFEHLVDLWVCRPKTELSSAP